LPACLRPDLEVRLIARLQARSFTTSADVREFPNGRTSVLHLDDAVVGFGVYQPGFRWSTDLAPLAGTPTCQVHHVGYAVAGTMHFVTDDGQELDVREQSVFEIPPGHDAWVVGDEPVVLIDWSGARAWRLEPEDADEEMIVTILMTDIVESTATQHRIGDLAWREQLALHNAQMREHLNVHRGREINVTGDSLVAVFHRPIRAVRCAEAMTATTRVSALPLRVGLHTGEIALVGDNPRGLAVHTAARVMALGGPGDVMVSSTTCELLEGSGITLEDAGEHDLKGLPGPRRVFRLGGVDPETART
jgi:class 3 adenylate cyclase